MKTVNVLWTGGLDSSYRIIELSRLAVNIQPYYIWDHTRGSIKQELRAIKRISKDVRENKYTKANLFPVKIVKDTDIEENASITQAWERMNQKYKLGSQYDYLARFARQNGLKLEVGLECSERSKAFNTIKSESILKLMNVNFGGKYTAYYIDIQSSSMDAMMLFENMLFPATLWHMSKLEEVEGYKKLGFGDSITKTWFCHRPVFGLPCGHCNPCKDCLNEGLAFRVPWLGYTLGSIRRILQGVKRRIKKIVTYKNDTRS